MILKKDWLNDVIAEVNNIKKYATKKEISNLDRDKFDAEEPTGCIYGMLAGHCSNDRAQQLIMKCCVRFTRRSVKIDTTFSESKCTINGKVKSLGRNFNTDFNSEYYSAVEHYILLRRSKGKRIIDYLKGEKDTLVL